MNVDWISRRSRVAFRRGFTAVELAIVFSTLALLAALSLPLVSRARESTRTQQCQDNLRQFGIGLIARADRRGAYCTGAMDWKRDGAVTEFGWVADLVNEGFLVGAMKCPANPNELQESYNDLLSASLSPVDHCNGDRFEREAGFGRKGPDAVGPCRKILGQYPGGIRLPAGSEMRRRIVENQILAKGYNSNYTASWFLARSGALLDETGNLKNTPGCMISIQEPACTAGPLKKASQGRTVAAKRIPLLACGGAAGTTLCQAIGPFDAGAGMIHAVTGGPVDVRTMQSPIVPPGTPQDGPHGWLALWSKGTLQDYRQFAPVHGGGKGAVCNILFVDGSVREFEDQNGDGYLNSGFDPAFQRGSIPGGFRDARLELPSPEIFTGWSLAAK